MRRFSQIKGLLFDKDGTLIDFSASWLQPIRQIARLVSEQAGDPELEMRLLIDGGYLPDEDRWAQDSTIAFDTSESLFQRWGMMTSPKLVRELAPQMRAIVLNSLGQAVPAVTGLAELLARLQLHYRLGVASMDDAINVRQTVEALGIADLLLFHCGADSGFGLKPGPGMVDAFCQRTGLRAQQVAVVGDGLHDLRMARAAGAHAIGVTSGAGSAEALQEFADLLIEDISELERHLPPPSG